MIYIRMVNTRTTSQGTRTEHDEIAELKEMMRTLATVVQMHQATLEKMQPPETEQAHFEEAVDPTQ